MKLLHIRLQKMRLSHQKKEERTCKDINDTFILIQVFQLRGRSQTTFTRRGR